MRITLGDVTFDRVRYDGDADVLYMHVGDPRAAIRFDESREGHALRFDADGALIGVTVVNMEWLAAREGEVRVTAGETVTLSAETVRRVLARCV